ncbi:sigma-70 family RNA polymerase sigma factor [Schlesneria paludicola]|uniref:sigma-70 family RNA polymerase sigma factor n=1 Tax=Schlesneria paludicola TaxID=360056 RepID=UPI00029A9F65|nr:sigma-70 family RNA polymerase sigma factor [Schlesneria paludicola]
MEADQFFEILVREHADMLMVYLRTVVRDPVTVDDLFQETMLTAWRTIERFDRERPFGPWLRGIAGKLILAWRRKSASQPRLCDEQVLEQLDRRMSQVQRLNGDTFDEKLEALRDCIRNLPEAYRQTIELRYQEEMKPVSITQHLKLNSEAVKKRLQRARIMLLECLTGKLASVGTK